MVTKPRFGGVFFCLEPARQQRAVQNIPSLKPQAKLVKRATNPQATRKGVPVSGTPLNRMSSVTNRYRDCAN